MFTGYYVLVHMVTFSGNLTNPPSISTSDLAGTVKNWFGFILVVGMAVFAFALAQNTVAPKAESLFNRIPGSPDSGNGIEVV